MCGYDRSFVFGLLQFSLHQPQLAQQIKEQTAFQELCSKLLCKTRRTLSFGWSQKQKPENRRQEKKPENKRKKAVGNGKKIESKWNTPIGWRWAAWLQEIRICGRRMESKTHSAISARRSLGWRHANEQEKMEKSGTNKTNWQEEQKSGYGTKHEERNDNQQKQMKETLRTRKTTQNQLLDEAAAAVAICSFQNSCWVLSEWPLCFFFLSRTSSSFIFFCFSHFFFLLLCLSPLVLLFLPLAFLGLTSISFLFVLFRVTRVKLWLSWIDILWFSARLQSASRASFQQPGLAFGKHVERPPLIVARFQKVLILILRTSCSIRCEWPLFFDFSREELS